MHKKIEKPWGFEVLKKISPFEMIKFLYIKEGYRTSLHYHERRMENLIVKKGQVLVNYGDMRGEFTEELQKLEVGQNLWIEPKTVHSIYAVVDSIIEEHSTPLPDDVIRVRDFYGRSVRDS